MMTLHRLPPVPETIDLLSNAEVEYLLSRDPSFWIPTVGEPHQARCRTCGGKGEFRWYDENDEVVTYDCDCFGQHRLWSAMLIIGIPHVYQTLRWKDLTETDPLAIAEIREGWFGRLDFHLPHGIGIYLWGEESGSGKTSIGYLAIKELMRQGVNCFTTSFRDLIDMFSASFRNEGDKEWLQKRVKNSRVLLIDNLGKETAVSLDSDRMASSERLRAWFDPLFNELLVSRVQSGRPTIITSSRSPEWMVKRFGPEMESFFTSMMVVAPKAPNFYHSGHTERMVMESKLGLTRPVTLGE